MPGIKAVRTIKELPIIKGFRPLWMHPNYRSAITLQLEEYEVLRLMDYEGMIHEQAAQQMQVSRPTITRIYEQARKKLATALVEGRSILIEGGEVQLKDEHFLCEDCRHKFTIQNTENKKCPDCGSQRIISLSNCFIGGCKCCRKCR